MTKLEAINQMLTGIGERPINTLEGNLPSNAEIAITILDTVDREIQATGWAFNTDREYVLMRDTDDEINLPSTTLRFDSNAYHDVVIRGLRLWNRVDKSYKFDSTVEGIMIALIPFEDVPFPVANYIVKAAGHRFGKAVVGASEIYSFTAEDVQKAQADAVSHEADQADFSMCISPRRRAQFSPYMR